MGWQRTNQTLVGKLAKLVDGKWQELNEFLPYAIYAYRVSPRKMTKASPFELLYGRRANNMCDKFNDEPIQEENGLLVERLNYLREKLINEEKKIREIEIGKVKRGRAVNDIEVGEYVRRRKLESERENKLDYKFDGV
ncbi:hypothetical protein NGRA_2654 [Nosema granulosis]|uniref:Uncharacterized protein n=1 Tax=Nosema granulosis TaxID=83296 RepID=A0A9P6KXH9_9MICR|nr:hypothetical protein NGRA_2654 [Nosema granulosis]